MNFRPARPFEPPNGFSAVSLHESAATKGANIFSNLHRKQIWHITAPVGVSLKDLKQMAMEKALDGKAILNYKGAEYGFSRTRMSEEGAREVLLPQKTGYKAGKLLRDACFDLF